VITKLSHCCYYVLDQDSAKEFYTSKLGFEVRNDLVMGSDFSEGAQGIRWLTVSPPGQPEVEIILADTAMGHDAETAAELRSLVAKGALGAGAWETDDCHKTFRELSERGVVFLQEPADRPYGVEAVFRDDSGNWFSLTERRAG